MEKININHPDEPMVLGYPARFFGSDPIKYGSGWTVAARGISPPFDWEFREAVAIHPDHGTVFMGFRLSEVWASNPIAWEEFSKAHPPLEYNPDED